MQKRVDHLFVEGVGGWMVPISADYFVSDLAVEMKAPVLIVAKNRLGCLNHTALTVRSLAEHGIRCVGGVLNSPENPTDIPAATNADILRAIIDVPLLTGLTENMAELPSDWGSMLDSIVRRPVSPE